MYLCRSVGRNNSTKWPDVEVRMRLGHLYLKLELDWNLRGISIQLLGARVHMWDSRECTWYSV